MADYVLGLDLGPNSIGWAALSADFREEGGHLVHTPTGFLATEQAGHPPLGVRVFEAGLAQFNTAKEESLCQGRRTARSMRRNHRRRNARRRDLKAALVAAALLPSKVPDQEEVFQVDPYLLRSKALDQPLSPFQLGRALYHLGQRRGFQSNRKSGQSKEDKGMLKEIGELAAAISDVGARTLGEYLFRLGGGPNGDRQALLRGETRLRNRHTRRDMYREEFDAIIAAQAPHHPEALSDGMVARYREAIFFQHPFELTEERRRRAPGRANLHRAPSVRPCPLEPGERCCPKGDWYAQRFRILLEVNNLRLAEHFNPERELRPEEREVVLELLSRKERVKFDELRKELAKIGVDPNAKFNLERGDRSSLNGNSVDYKLSVAIGKAGWKKLDDDLRGHLRDALLNEEDEGVLHEQLLSAGAKPEKAEKLLGWAPSDGYVAYSRKALMALLPYLEGGMKKDAAVQEAYPDRPSAAAVDKLPALSCKDLPAELKDITNPVVRRALVEVRKVINAMVREHGKPRRIVVELARDMKGGPEERKRFSKKNREREERRRDAQEVVHELGGNPRSRSDVNRFLLWQEQGGLCPYTGKAIPQSEILHEGEWEVDHILPRWQSLDDSMMNKVLVHRPANHEKSNRTPAQWLGIDSEDMRLLVQRVEEMATKHKMPWGKVSRLKQAAVGADGFALRQLNDTRYITRAVVNYLELLFPQELRTGEKAVMSCRGSLTAELRRQWGLVGILDPLLDIHGEPVMAAELGDDGAPRKSRADHRHHAIDAVVVALSSRSNLKRYQDHWKAREDLAAADAGRQEMAEGVFLPPWDSFREDVKARAKEILVSHRPLRKVGGAFHEETFFGQAKEWGKDLPGLFVTRKRLDQLTPKMVAGIRDATIRQVVTRRLEERGWKGGSSALPKDWQLPEVVMESGVPIRRVRVLEKKKNPVQLGHRFAVLGNNHHLAVLEEPAAEGEGKLVGQVVPRMEAARRVRREGMLPVERVREDDRRFVMSLARKESVLVRRPGTDEVVLSVVQVVSGTNQPGTGIDLYLRDACDSRPASEGNKAPLLRLKSFRKWRDLGICKVQVDPLGRMAPAGD